MHWRTTFPDESFFLGLQRELPPLITREMASRMTGGLFSARTLSNLDARGRGPGRKQRFGKKIVYTKEDFLNWLRQLRYGQ